ncbi:MAG: hypothetical protein BWY17_01081 [Deltaproteobacteria bacterium ADurb.Bin207]|nr:MAG: hypothetical protein BWY17_01081 [Deltaproteobacteria bacterium ADurb.Bin207]
MGAVVFSVVLTNPWLAISWYAPSFIFEQSHDPCRRSQTHTLSSAPSFIPYRGVR